MSTKKSETRLAIESLRKEYQSDEELTAFTKLDSEPFREIKLGANYTIDPELQGKCDNDPYFQEKVDRANDILQTAGIPEFPEKLGQR